MAELLHTEGVAYSETQSKMAEGLPKVILGQLGCSYGKSTILAVYANYLKELHKDAKVIVCTPTPWLKH